MEKIYSKIQSYFSARSFFLFLTALTLTLIFLNLLKNWSFPDQNWSLNKDEKMKVKTEVIQKFEAERNGLSLIKVLFGNSKVGSGGRLTLKIFDETCSSLIREAHLDISQLNSDNTNNFTFSRIKDSQGKTFCLNLSYQSKENKKSTASANIFVIANTMPQNKYLSVDGQEFSGQSLSFRPGYRDENWRQNIQELNQRLSQYKPWFLKHYYLYFVVFSFIILSLFLVALLVAA